MTLRRFEFVEGTSSKFWSVDVDDSTFVVVYGRIGTPGSRKEKVFATKDAAGRERDKKVAEKLREGYSEVGSSPLAGRPPKAPVKPVLPKLPPRLRASASASTRTRTEARPPGITQRGLDHAAQSLALLESELGGRSWRVAAMAHRAAQSLRSLGAPTLGALPSLGPVLQSLMDSVVSQAGSRRLPLSLAMELLYELDASAFTLTLGRWKSPPESSPGYPSITAIHSVFAAIRDPELSLRAARTLSDRRDPSALADAGWEARWRSLRAHLDEELSTRGGSVLSVLSSLDSQTDPQLARRITRMSSP